MMHQDDEIYEDLYGEELDGMCEILVEAIHVDLDSGWNPGSTLSFYAYPYRNDAFHTIVNCQRSINWTPDAPVYASACFESCCMRHSLDRRPTADKMTFAWSIEPEATTQTPR